MKKNNLIIFLLFINITTFSQNNKNNGSELKETFLSLPDSAFYDNIFDFPKGERQIFWELYMKDEYEHIEISTDKIVGELNLFFENDLFRRAFLIEKCGLLRIVGAYDTDPVYEIKDFCYSKKKIIAITLKYYDFASDVTKKIIFYEYRNHKYRDISEEVLNSFNFKKDNYSDSTLKLINEIYGYDVISNPYNSKLLYRFTASDTVYISESFFGTDKELYLDKRYFDGEFYTKKYIMDNGKLRLAE